MCNERILILCEGPTVRCYVQALISELPRVIRRVVTVEVFFQNEPNSDRLITEAHRLENKAVRERNPYTSIWLCLEVGEVATLNRTLASINGTNYRLAYAAPCIETWYALHFQQLDRPYADSALALQELNRYWPEYRRIGFNPLPMLRDSLPTALSRAEALNELSRLEDTSSAHPLYVTVPDLIKYLEKLKKQYG